MDVLLKTALMLAFMLGISIWNNFVVANAWAEAEHARGKPWFMVWVGYLITSLGYSWVLIVIAALSLAAKERLNQTEVEGLLSLGYLIVLPGFLFGAMQFCFRIG